MPEDAEFGALYKKLLDKHVAPNAGRKGNRKTLPFMI